MIWTIYNLIIQRSYFDDDNDYNDYNDYNQYHHNYEYDNKPTNSKSLRISFGKCSNDNKKSSK